jgi:hypothetical protein
LGAVPSKLRGDRPNRLPRNCYEEAFMR